MTIEQFNFAGKKAIVRVDFNVPLDENGNVTDDTRIRGALPTLKKVLADGGALIMMSHMGKPKGKVNAKLSLSQIVKNVSDALGVDVKFAKDAGKADAEVAALQGGEALLRCLCVGLGPGTAGSTTLPTGARQIRNDYGSFAWGGVCPPPGDKPHRYVFTVHALSVPKLDVPDDATAALAGFMINANAIATASFTAHYGR